MLEAYYRSLKDEVPLDKEGVVAAIEQDLHSSPYGREPGWEIDRYLGLMEVVFDEYVANYHESDLQREWLFVEEPFQEQLGPIIQRGKPDLGSVENGKYWLWDHKTKGWYNEEQTKAMLPHDFQMASYKRALEKKYGLYFAGVVYNIIRMPQQRVKFRGNKMETMQDFLARVRKDIQNNSPEPYFRRLRCKSKRETTQANERSMLLIAEGFAKWCSEGKQPIPNHQACFDFNKPCEFFNACHHGNYAQLYKGNPFQELDDGAVTNGEKHTKDGPK